MPITVVSISNIQAIRIRGTEEGQFADLKAKEIAPKKLTKAISAFANADGGELFIGIANETRRWEGFKDQEDANGHLQIFETLFPLGTDFQYEFLKAEGERGLVLHVVVNKTQAIMLASDEIPYLRRGAASQPVTSKEALKRLEYAKGIVSFEQELTNVPLEVVSESEVIKTFINEVVPSSTPETWLKSKY